MRRLALALGLLTLTGLGVAVPALSVVEGRGQQAALTPIVFNRDIRPILSNNCFACHGPDEQNRKTKFHFDTQEGMFLEPGVIVPGNAAQSLLYQHITDPDPAQHMPPPDSGYSLTQKQIDLLKRWIDEGAKWDSHWAYTPPKRPDVPDVTRDGWTRNPIDQFILARLEREGLAPSPEADKVTLLRRLSYDLTGLPPTPAEVDAFLADRSPDAYEKRVDALLQSPRYGERMAMPWLDASRYADSHGYHIDSLRGMWPWRDWVIDAFNRNLPYDQFVIEQIAGDLIPGATREQKIASGFNRNHMINFEGGAIAEEYQVEYVMDRADATSSAFMGLTMGCARCHSHKFDPISHKEFYQFFAFFNNVPERGLDGRTGNAAPLLPLPSHEQVEQYAALNTEISARDSMLSDAVVSPMQAQWEQMVASQPMPATTDGLIAHYELESGFSDISGRYQHGRTVTGDPTFGAGAVGRAVTFDGDTEVSFGDVGGFDRSSPFSMAVWFRPTGNTALAGFQKLDDRTRRGLEWSLDDVTLAGVQRWAGKLTVALASDAPERAIRVRTRERMRLGDWHHVALTYDGSGKAAGLQIFVGGKASEVDVLADALDGPSATTAPLRLGSKALGRIFKGGIDDLRLYNRTLTPAQVEQLAVHYAPRVVISGVNGRRLPAESTALREYFLTYVAPDNLKQAHVEVKALRARRADLDQSIPSAMIMGELSPPRQTFILARGDYRNQTEKVQPGVPAMLGALPKDAPLNRMTLAKWLVAPGHPLTARVAVNRFWQSYFGYGIVKTQEDFGVQGEAPVHPELLDWLATEFIRTGWDTRAMQRLIVTSATYRQSSKMTPALLEKDPENRLLARGTRVRLPAELIRDTALAASGLLNSKIGGPSVFPYQPPGLWEEMAFGEGFTVQAYAQSHGEDLYRRSMYTFWKRTVPPASLATFDAPDREKCTARRAMTNTPLQALVLLNDPTYVEASRALAQRGMTQASGDTGRMDLIFRLATGRRPASAESTVLRQLLNTQRSTYRKNRKAAEDLISVGESKRDAKLDASELAAWTTVASTVLNLDETITKQ